MSELVWTSADAEVYLPEGDLNKLNRVLGGLRALNSGGRPDPSKRAVPADPDRLRDVVSDLASRLVIQGLLDSEQFGSALARDGFKLDGENLVPTKPPASPVEKVTDYVMEVLGGDEKFSVAMRHYEQANRAFDRKDWEAGNAQFRSTLDAVFDALAQGLGCPSSKTGGTARKWLQDQEHLAGDEADLIKSFMVFAGRAGSHAGVSEAAVAQLRRHFAAALIVFATQKLGR